MTDDLVKRLRELNTFEWHAKPATTKETCFAAADLIEKLETALQEIADIHPFKDPEGDISVKSLVDLVFHINITARRALEGKDD
jgi:hypothetical protein